MNRYHGRWSSYLFALPFLVLFGLFVLWPIGYGLYLSVMRYELTAPQLSEYVSFGNYAEAFGDRYFWKAASVTLGYVVVVSSITVIIALVLAMGIDRVNGRWQHLYRMPFLSQRS